MPRDRCGLLDMREMPAPLHHHKPRIRQPLVPQPGIGWRHDPVVAAPDDERRQFDAVQPLLKIGIEPARLPAELRPRKGFRSITSICSSLGVKARMRSAKDWSW